MRLLASSITAALWVAATSPALAGDPAAAAPTGDAAAAQTLFYEARQLMKEYRFGLACPKLEESLRLDYGIGTEFNLADCHEKVGKVATAWSGFLSVAAAAHKARQPEREKVARDRAKALEPRLPKLTVEVAAPAPETLEVKRDGVVVAPAAWNVAVPVDPGPHRITAQAPGKQPWDGNVTAAEGKAVKIAIPTLQAAVANAEPAKPNLSSPAPAPAPPIEERASTTTVTSFPEPVVENPGATQRSAGWIFGGLGIASLGVGGAFGITSLVQRQRATHHCNASDVCDAQGLRYRENAIQSGDIATITTIAGAAAMVGGLVLVLTAPKSPSRERASALAVTSLHAVPRVATNGASLSLEGVLP